MMELYARGSVWACERVGSVTLTPKQVEALMREHTPTWFDDGESAT